MQAAGYRWHVQTFGQGPVALLLHGTGAATHSWRAFAPLLAQYFTVVAPDLPGHGFTEIPAVDRLSLVGMSQDISALLVALGVQPQLAIGHSAGAAILLRMAIDRMIDPKLIVGLNGAFLPFGGFVGRFFLPLAKMMTLNPFVPRFFAWRGRDPIVVHRLIENTGSSIDAEGERLYGTLVGSPDHVAAALHMMANWDLRPLVRDLPKLNTRLLLIAATSDRAVPPSVSRRVCELVPNARLQIVEGLGHLAHEEQPETIAKIIVADAADAGISASQQEMST